METQGCKQCQQKSPSSAPDEEFCWLQRHRSSRHDWPHTRAERGWKKTQPTKQVPGCLSFPCSLWFTKEHSTQIWEGMFFQRQSGMWSVSMQTGSQIWQDKPAKLSVPVTSAEFFQLFYPELCHLTQCCVLQCLAGLATAGLQKHSLFPGSLPNQI